MKKFRLLSLLWIVLLASTLAGCWNNEQATSNGSWDFIVEDISWENDAVINYNDELVDMASNCIVSEDNIRNTYDDENASIEDIKAAIDDTINICTDASKNIETLWDWEWDSSLKDWVLNIIEKYITYYTKFSEMLPYIAQEEITEDQNEAYQSLLAEVEALDNELSEANNNLITIQEQFASNYWFELETDQETVQETQETNQEITE